MIIRRDFRIEDLLNNNAIKEKLRAYGLIVEDGVDEFSEVCSMFQSQIDNPSTYTLTINPTLKCNFRCWYCYEDHAGNTKMSDIVLDKVKKSIERIMDDYPSLNLMFFGGEPLLEFDSVVKPLMEHTKMAAEKKGKHYSVSFTTNGFLITKEMAEFFSRFNTGSFQITLDGDRESHNNNRASKTKDSFMTIVENIHMLTGMGLNVLLRLNVTKDNVKSCLKITDYFTDLTQGQKEHLSVIVQQVWQDSENDLSEDFLPLYRSFAKIGLHIVRNFSNRLQSPCYGDKLHSAVINYNGNIYKCTAIDFDKFQSEGDLTPTGEIILDNSQQTKRERLWKEQCKTCSILPMCCGGCAKVLYGNRYGKTCPYPTVEEKNKYIIRTIKEQLFMEEIGQIKA